MSGVPTCATRVDAALVEALDTNLGPPLDSYVRGWQVWLEDLGPQSQTLECRLHPPARFRMPRGVDPHDLFGLVLGELAGHPEPDELLTLGAERRSLGQVWEILEVFPAFGHEPGPDGLVEVVERTLGRAPDVAGHADHARLGDLWKGKRGDFSVGQVLLEQLEPVGR